jgi:hypothetical protein
MMATSTRDTIPGHLYRLQRIDAKAKGQISFSRIQYMSGRRGEEERDCGGCDLLWWMRRWPMMVTSTRDTIPGHLYRLQRIDAKAKGHISFSRIQYMSGRRGEKERRAAQRPRLKDLGGG